MVAILLRAIIDFVKIFIIEAGVFMQSAAGCVHCQGEQI